MQLLLAHALGRLVLGRWLSRATSARRVGSQRASKTRSAADWLSTNFSIEGVGAVVKWMIRTFVTRLVAVQFAAVLHYSAIAPECETELGS